MKCKKMGLSGNCQIKIDCARTPIDPPTFASQKSTSQDIYHLLMTFTSGDNQDVYTQVMVNGIGVEDLDYLIDSLSSIRAALEQDKCSERIKLLSDVKWLDN